MSDEFDGKLECFECFWDGVMLKGVNCSKLLKFR